VRYRESQRDRRRQGRAIRKARRTGTMGRVYWAPLGTELPADQAWPDGWLEIGFTTEGLQWTGSGTAFEPYRGIAS
jgi:hypothetical protein